MQESRRLTGLEENNTQIQDVNWAGAQKKEEGGVTETNDTTREEEKKQST